MAGRSCRAVSSSALRSQTGAVCGAARRLGAGYSAIALARTYELRTYVRTFGTGAAVRPATVVSNYPKKY